MMEKTPEQKISEYSVAAARERRNLEMLGMQNISGKDREMRDKVTGYMCATDFEHEAGSASDGVRVFPSEKAVWEHLHCVGECGIVKVTISRVETVREPQDDWNETAQSYGRRNRKTSIARS